MGANAKGGDGEGVTARGDRGVIFSMQYQFVLMLYISIY